MRKATRGLVTVMLALLLGTMVVGCSEVETPMTSDGMRRSYDTNYAVEGEGAVAEEADVYEDEASAKESTSQLEAPEKMVYTADVALSTREFDTSNADLDKRIESAGAVVFGDNLWQDEWSDVKNRTRQLTVRVAAEGLKDFVKSIEEVEAAKVTSSNLQASDRTKEYNDSEDRIELLRQEYEFYEKTVQETDDPETRLVYTDRMFELLDEIKSLEDRKSDIDQDVAYSVVTITLNEDTSLAEHDGGTGLWQEIQDSFVTIPQNVAAAFGYLLLFLIEALPLLLILGIIAAVVVLVVRRRRAKRRQRLEAAQTGEQPSVEARPVRPPAGVQEPDAQTDGENRAE